MPRPPPRRRAHGPSSGSGHRPWLQQSQQPPTTSWAQVSSALEVGAAFLHEPVVVSGWVISGTVVGIVWSVSPSWSDSFFVPGHEFSACLSAKLPPWSAWPGFLGRGCSKFDGQMLVAIAPAAELNSYKRVIPETRFPRTLKTGSPVSGNTSSRQLGE